MSPRCSPILRETSNGTNEIIPCTLYLSIKGRWPKRGSQWRVLQSFCTPINFSTDTCSCFMSPFHVCSSLVRTHPLVLTQKLGEKHLLSSTPTPVFINLWVVTPTGPHPGYLHYNLIQYQNFCYEAIIMQQNNCMVRGSLKHGALYSRVTR